MSFVLRVFAVDGVTVSTLKYTARFVCALGGDQPGGGVASARLVIG